MLHESIQEFPPHLKVYLHYRVKTDKIATQLYILMQTNKFLSNVLLKACLAQYY